MDLITVSAKASSPDAACARSHASRLLILALLLGGCSLSISPPPPNRPRLEAPACDTGKSLVFIDGVWATVAGLVAIAAFGEGEGQIGGFSLLVAGAFVGGAAKGNSSADACRAAYTEYSNETAADLVAAEDARAALAAARVPASTLAAAPLDANRPLTGAPASPVVLVPPPAGAAVAKTVAPLGPPVPAQVRPQPAANEDWDAFWEEVP